MRILLVEDDRLIGDGIRVGLGPQGFAVDWLTDGDSAVHALEGVAYDAAVLDLTLPGRDGLDVLRRWRDAGQTLPVLVLTARDALNQRVEGLNLGADDYLGKPFALEELAARLRALTRRGAGRAAPPCVHGDIRFDPQRRTVLKNGVDAGLSPRETMLVELFLLHQGRPLSRRLLEDKLYPWGDEVCSNAVEVHIHNLRRKLGRDFVKTLHGQGYILGNPA